MADNRKVIKITLGGTEMKMKYTLLSMVKLEKEGIRIQELGEQMSLESVLKVLWAGLITFQPELTVDEVGAMVDIADLSEITEKLTEAFGGLQGKK